MFIVADIYTMSLQHFVCQSCLSVKHLAELWRHHQCIN